MIKNIKRAYGMGAPSVKVFPAPILMGRVPTAADVDYAIGQTWLYAEGTGTDDVYMLLSRAGGTARWVNLGGGSGAFDTLAVAGAATIGTALTLSAGSLTLSALTAGTMRTSAAGVVSTLADGANGTVLIGTTGGTPVWATLASTTLVITEAAGTITLEESGGTANSFVTDAGGPIAPLVGVTSIIGYPLGSISTDGTVANTIRIRLADTITSVAGIVATAGLSMLGGTCAITSDANVAEAMYLRANGGVNETIRIHSDQGTGAASVSLESDLGGVVVSSGLAGAASVHINASNAAGGITADYGTGGCLFTGVNGTYTIATGTGNLSLGADAADHDTLIGSITGVSAMTLRSGTNAMTFTAGGIWDVNATGDVTVDTSGGDLNFGSGANATNVNIATGIAAMVVSIGNVTTTTGVTVNCGTGGASFGASNTAHTTTIGGTNGNSNLLLQTGTGSVLGTFGGILDFNVVGAVTIDSSTAPVNIATDDIDQAVNIATDGERVTTIGSNNGAAGVVVDCGTGDASFGATATEHQTTIGSTNAASNLLLQTGTGSVVVTAGGILDINGTGDYTCDVTAGIYDISVSGNMTFDSSGGTISVGADDIDQAITIGLNGERLITIGNQVGAAGLVLESGTVGTSINASGLLSTQAVTDTQAGAATTVSANVGQSIHTGLTTAAGATQELTITNTLCTANSVILATCTNFGANDAQMYISRVVPGAGSFVVTVANGGAAALNGNISIAFWLLQV